jgi:thiol:disulfide interchange protein
MKDSSKIFGFIIQGCVTLVPTVLFNMIPKVYIIVLLAISLLFYLFPQVFYIKQSIKRRRRFTIITSIIAFLGVIGLVITFNNFSFLNNEGNYLIMGSKYTSNAYATIIKSNLKNSDKKEVARIIYDDFENTSQIWEDVGFYENLIFSELIFFCVFFSITVSSSIDIYNLKVVQKDYDSK